MDRKRVCVLFVHGIAGSPRVFDFLDDSIPEGIDVFYITLLGHGGKSSSFFKGSYRKWKNQVREEIERLSSIYDRIVIVSHSMGTLLSIENSNVSEKISALLLICSPLKVRVGFDTVRIALKVAFCDEKKIDPISREAKRCQGIKPTKNPFAYLFWTKPFLSLLVNIPKTRKKVSSLDKRHVFYVSDKDELVSMKSLKYIPETSEKMVMKGCGHYLFSDEMKNDIKEKLLEYIEE